MMGNRNMTMLCDFYELTMAGGYFRNNMHRRNAYFDVFSAPFQTAAVLLSQQVLRR